MHQSSYLKIEPNSDVPNGVIFPPQISKIKCRKSSELVRLSKSFDGPEALEEKLPFPKPQSKTNFTLNDNQTA